MQSPQAFSSEPPFRVTVKELLASRYEQGVRPLSWDERTAGADTILTTDGVKLSLQSDGQQSPPQPGWTILITGGNESQGFTWTLYGVPHGSAS